MNLALQIAESLDREVARALADLSPLEVVHVLDELHALIEGRLAVAYEDLRQERERE